MWKVEWINNEGRHINEFGSRWECDEFIDRLRTFDFDYMCYEVKNLTFDKLIQYCWENNVTDTFFSENGFHIVDFEKGNFKEKKGACNIGRFDKFKIKR